MITKPMIENWFRYHGLTTAQETAETMIMAAGESLALIILENTCDSADQSAAIRKVREAVMTANAAIACGGR